MAHVATPSAAVAVAAGADGALSACFHETGYGSNEPSLRVLRDGTVTLYPAFTADGPALLRSQDDGRSWTPLRPDTGVLADHLGRVQPFLYVDPATDRTFAFSSVLQPAPTALGNGQLPALGMRMLSSADGGRTWRGQLVGREGLDWIKMLSGPPVTSTTKGYPNVLYLTLPTPISTPITAAVASVQLPDRQRVYRSLDGGTTWEQVGSMSLKTRDVPGCPQTEFVLYGNGVVDRKGAIHLGLRRCANLGVATSRDEGRTWTVKDVPGARLTPITSLVDAQVKPEWLASEPLAVDAHGTLYATWTGADRLLHLAVSRDAGGTWSSPVLVSAPGVNRVTLSAATAGARPGQLALAYYGSRDGGETYDAWVAESLDAGAARPVFTSVMANNPQRPLYSNDAINRTLRQQSFDPGYLSLVTTGLTVGLGDMNELLQVRYAPDGTIWSSFSQRMCKGFGYFECRWDVAANEGSLFELAAASVTRTAAGPALGLPPARRCVSRRRFTIHLARSLRSATITVAGRRLPTLRGRRLQAAVSLRGLPRGTFTVRIVGRTATGRRVVATRTYRTCRSDR